MKTLENYKLLIDANCPMCKMYGRAFEKYELIEKGTCSPYQYVDVSLAQFINMARAKNEIALFNTKTLETVYGVKAFEVILTHSLEGLIPIFKNNTINALLEKIYKLISSNRKVIAPSKKDAKLNDCTPDLNLKYRLIYMMIVAFFSSFILNKYTLPINQLMGWQSNFGRELAISFGQIVWQAILLNTINRNKLFDYLGNMITVSLIGTLLLLPVLILSNFIVIPAIVFLIYFVLVVGFMFLEHMRRCQILELGLLASASWLTYRLLVLVLIIFLS